MKTNTGMEHKVGKNPDGGSKKRKETGNDITWSSMFAMQEAASDLNKARLACNTQLQKGK
jgi:hypothetical protein